MSANTGGPAYPLAGMTLHGQQAVQAVFHTGMTVRQVYKAAIAQGLLAGRPLPGSGDVTDFINAFTSVAGKLADALLAEDQEHAKK